MAFAIAKQLNIPEEKFTVSY